MPNNSHKLNSRDQELSRGGDFFGLGKNFYISCNFFLALKVLHDKADEEDFRNLYDKNLFLEALKTQYTPHHIREISEKLWKWEEKLTDLLQKIENNREDYADYYNQVRETEATDFDAPYKYQTALNWYYNHDYYELEATREILAELNPEIDEHLEAIGAKKSLEEMAQTLA